MATKTCINGHIYDSSVYGDNCPFCPSEQTINISGTDSGTKVNEDSSSYGTKKTEVMNESNETGTIIRRIGNSKNETNNGSNRKLVGILVSYDTNPLGEVYKLYEGRNLIGRRQTMDISIPDDPEISSEHLMILYREAEGIFWATDQKSSNGTYVNGKFTNEAQLNSYDTISIGNTRLIFIAFSDFAKNSNNK